MVELFFLKRFLIQSFIPYSVLITSISYIIFELICPKNKKEHFYLYSDKLYFKLIRRPLEKCKQLMHKLLIKMKSKLKLKILKRRDKKALKEKEKQRKELKINEKAKSRLNKKIDKVNRKIEKKNKRKLFFKCLLKKIFKSMGISKKTKKTS